MEIKIQNSEQLSGILYTWLSQNHDCVVEVRDVVIRQSIFYSSVSLSDNTVLLSFSIGEKSVGDVIKANDGKARMNWIKEKCSYINFSEANLVVNLHTESKALDFSIDDIRKITPIKITTYNEAKYLFYRFLNNENANKLLITFSTYISDLKYNFKLEMVIDKVKAYNKTILIYFITPSWNLCNELYCNCISDYYHDIKESVENNMHVFEEVTKGMFIRCSKVSNNDIEIYASSNCELI